MDPVSLTLGIAGLAGLFSTCLDVIEKASLYKNFNSEHYLIHTQYEADRVLFQLWAQKVGIGKLRPQDTHHEYLDNPEIASIVQRILSSIQGIFTKTMSELSDMELSSKTGTMEFLKVNDHLAQYSAQTLSSQAAASKRHKVRWAFGGRDKSMERARMFSEMVSRLYMLVPPEDRNTLSRMCWSTVHSLRLLMCFRRGLKYSRRRESKHYRSSTNCMG